MPPAPPDPPENPGDPRVMSFGDHLEELRKRLIWALVWIAPIFIAACYWGDNLLALMLVPVKRKLAAAGLPPDLIATGPLETLGVWLKVTIWATLILGVPVFVYQLWLFVRPGLYPHERRYAQFLVPLSVALSILGLAFLYFVMLPAMLAFLITFGAGLGKPTVGTAPTPPGLVLPNLPRLDNDPVAPAPGAMWFNTDVKELRFNAAPDPAPGQPSPAPDIRGVPMTRSTGIAQQYRVSEYVDLVFTMGLAFVIGFQTPVVVLLLGWVGIVDRRTLARSRKYAFFLSFVAGAILTPSPDPFNMTLLALPLYGLFELGLLLLRAFPPERVARGIRAGDLVRSPQREGPDSGDE